MGKSSKSITLALIGSSLLLAGCSREPLEEEEDGQSWAQDQSAGHVRHSGGGVMFVPIPRIGGGGGGVRPGAAPGAGVSARGGFGASGSHGVGA